ncbi:hypothetical protein ACTXT7_009790 [Hymenolepis weldensis]
MPVKVRTKDDKITLIGDDIVKKMNLFKCINRSAFNTEEDDAGDSIIFLEPVPLETLKLVIKWCENHRKDKGDLFKGPAHNWRLRQDDKEFFTIHKNEVFKLLDAAYYLQIKPLFDATCVAIAGRLRNRDFNGISREFGISTCEPPMSAMINKYIRDSYLHRND